jgi:hypothetical protein
MSDPTAVEIKVPAKDPKKKDKKDEDPKDDKKPNGTSKPDEKEGEDLVCNLNRQFAMVMLKSIIR